MSEFAKAGGAAMSSRYDDWETPKWLFDGLDARYHFTLDPCSSDENAKCERHYTVDDDGLSKDWTGEVVFVNPPYGREIGKWVAKARHEHNANGATVVMLIPARTDTTWFHEHVYHHANITFLKGRLKFTRGGIEQGTAPFPSMIVEYA